MARRPHTFSRATRDVLDILGSQIAAARRESRWTANELASRAGISPKTLRDIERGAPTVSIGSVFEVAVLLRIPLYTDDDDARADLRSLARNRLALLGQRVRPRQETVDDDF
ncbi:helix-turn-helix domain-containing protein [Leifsonia sp. NPDC058248]|uniref:helix-turn-helix domain-containing protein n=1 Tax=Leifsonia sp. NPDC058248 TaxID=3346402 RepID=UPI0036D932EF